MATNTAFNPNQAAETSGQPLLLITGATGFLGQYVVTEALNRGYGVRGMTRQPPQTLTFPWQNHPSFQWLQGDLGDVESLKQGLKGVQGVIHLAAAKTGDYQQQFAATVEGTENLLTAMAQMKQRRLILVSSFSVFDYLSLSPQDTLDETSGIEPTPQNRDIYAQMKLLQEQTVKDFEKNHQGEVTILRPGIIYGRDNWWNAHLGANIKGRIWLNIKTGSLLPLIYVENCAQAIISSVAKDKAIGQTINLVDDELPTQNDYLQAIIKGMSSVPYQISVNRNWIALSAKIAWQINQGWLKNSLKLPGLLIPARFEARFKPLNYSNEKAKNCLNWTSQYSLEEALNRSFSADNLLSIET